MLRLTYATRKSQLALAQSRALVRRLGELHPGLLLEELTVVTTGDKVQDRPLSEIGGKGLFVKEIEQSLVDGAADIAVHSSKDVPGELAPGLVLGCFPPREDPRDVLVSRSGAKLSELPPGSRIGTTSLRRGLQLREIRPDLAIVPLRGNVDTRLRKCEEGVVDAVLLARAGLLRLGLEGRATEVLEPELCLPAVGQGALAIEQRAGDERVTALLAPLAHQDTTLAVSAERGVMLAVEGDCQTPVAAYALLGQNEIWLRGFLADPDGTHPRRAERRAARPASAEAALALGRDLGAELRGSRAR